MTTINERNPTPLTRDVLRGLKQKVDEEKRQKSIDDAVQMLYIAAAQTAKTSIDTFFSYVLPTYEETPYRLYGQEILDRVKKLFPDSDVSYNFVVLDNRGRRHILNKLDPALHPFIVKDRKNEFRKEWAIIIDWS